MSNSLLDNALASLHLALEDYAAGQEERLLSAVRNLHAGILLLYKEKLRQLSPSGTDDVLIMAKTKFQRDSSGDVIAVGTGKKTVDALEIQERFTSLGIKTDWDRFKKINDLRNDIEHRQTTATRGSMQEMISDTFLIIRDFIQAELQGDPKELLGHEAWNTLLSVSEVYEKEREECERALQAIDWQSAALAEAMLRLTCAECGSSLLFPLGTTREADVQCRSCGEDERFDNYSPRAISSYFADDNSRSMKDGGDPISITCPHCHVEGYIVQENCCAVCGESCETECSVCGSTIPVEELSDGNLCGYCDHTMSKDD